jgi:hypothetical protein
MILAPDPPPTMRIESLFFVGRAVRVSLPSSGDGESGARARLASRILGDDTLQRRRHRRQTTFRSAPQGLGASPNNPLPRPCGN